ncbi:MAG TPA: nitronate monooxygenase [Mycobacteriales bacterium]|nr:nitronate monooxygenase [Mycobacteriales bacterium]
MNTAFTTLVGCTQPIQLAPMGGGVGTPGLAAAVCKAGGLGMLSSAGPGPLADQMSALRELVAAPYGVGFFGFDLPHRAGELELAAAAARVIDLFWGEPDPAVVARIHRGGALAFWQVGSADEAVAAADAGCDVVVAQGVEAGGHVRGTTPLRLLLDQVVDRIGVPVVAAGGITTSKHVRAAFDSGASAVRVGTRFLATAESAAHPEYVAALLAAGADDTELTTAFHRGWEDAPHRVLRGAVAAATAASEPVGWWEQHGRRHQVDRWSALPPTRSCTGNVAAMAMYAGSGVGEITDVMTVAEVVDLLFRENP